jgi:hypothetical protein
MEAKERQLTGKPQVTDLSLHGGEGKSTEIVAADLNQTDFFGALTLAQWSALNGYDQTTRRYSRID